VRSQSEVMKATLQIDAVAVSGLIPCLPAMGEESRNDQLQVDIEPFKRLALGDRAALAELYDRFSRPLFSLALKALGSRAEAEEVIQDVFVTAWKNRTKIDVRRGAIAWLSVVTRNRCIDRIRARQSRIPTWGGEDQSVPELIETRTALDEAVSREEAGNVRRAVQQLPAEQREAIDLAFFSGLSHSEIAKRLDVPLGTVKSRVRYGVEKLRTDLKGGTS
jgi:RNA polymerase sigma-70 factor (ECF subfamily)